MHNSTRDRKQQLGRTRAMDGAFLAVLSNRPSGQIGTAICRLNDIVVDENGVSPRVQVLPDGFLALAMACPQDTEHKAWLMDQAAWTLLKRHLDERANDLHFDYEHQTIFAESNGKAAPLLVGLNPLHLSMCQGKVYLRSTLNGTTKLRHTCAKTNTALLALCSITATMAAPSNLDILH